MAAALSPAAVVNPAGDLVAYHSWERGRPILRLHDLERGVDTVMEEGAYSLAWRRDGALAYFIGVTPRVPDAAKDRGHVIVRDEPGGSPIRWTKEPAPYVVAAWARDNLLAYRRRGTTTDVLVFDGPGRMRVLAERSYVVAVSPSGHRVFLSTLVSGVPRVFVVKVDTGRTVASLSLRQRDPISHRPLNYVSYSGSWQRDSVVAAVSNGLAVFEAGDDDIALNQLIGLDPDTFPTGVSEPAMDSSADSIVASAELITNPNAALNQIALIECVRASLTCEIGPSGLYAQPPRLMYDPSRPR
ncbi:MAG: hypothetical protein M3280_02935 [Actinomycetota bacterium]|nr:hypothetical protein [Actinomycetota bacterium]